MTEVDFVCSELITKGFLVTSARETLHEIQRGIVKVNTINSVDSSRDAPTLHVSDRSNRTWIIPLAQCSTWLVSAARSQPAVIRRLTGQDFIAHFSTLTKDFESNYYVMYRKAIQRPENWQSLVALAAKQTALRLILRSCR